MLFVRSSDFRKLLRDYNEVVRSHNEILEEYKELHSKYTKYKKWIDFLEEKGNRCVESFIKEVIEYENKKER